MVTRSLSVRSKLALLFFAACALTFGVGGSFISRSVTNSLEDEILARLEFESRAYATALDGQLSLLSRRAEDFASDGFVRDTAEQLLASSGAEGSGKPEGSEGALALERFRDSLQTHLLVNKLPLVPAFLDLDVVSTSGQLLATVHGQLEPEIRAWVAGESTGVEHLASKLFAPVSSGGQPHLVLAAPLIARIGGRRLGWLVAVINPGTWVYGALRESGLAGGGSGQQSASDPHARIHLLDESGARLTLQPSLFGGGFPGPNSPLASSGFGITYSAQAAHADHLDAGTAQTSLVRSFPLRLRGWSLQVESDTGEALAAVASLQGRIFGLGLLVAAAACILFLLPMGILTRPLLQLAEAARRLGAGEEVQLEPSSAQDEIGEVTRSFELMAQAVQERTRLQERTAQDLRQRQGELKAERDRLKAVIGSMRGGLIVLDPDGRPVVSNQAAEPVLAELQRGGVDISSHHVCERGNSADDACNSCLFDVSRAPKSCQVEIGNRVFEVHASQLPPDVDGRVGRVLVCLDFTDRVMQDDRMIHQERLAVLGEVAAVMAHELNNPLASISMYNQMLARELADEPDLSENVEVIQRNVESCKRAIRELLDYATGATPEVDSIDICAVLQDVAAFTRPLRERGEIELGMDLPGSSPLVWGDELQVRQIFVNLMVNAIQALSPKGGKVTISVKGEGNHVLVTFADDGPGIPSSAQSDIFRPFFTTKGRGEGTGLGLPTARRIAEMHGGGVELVKTGPDGTVFRVRLMQQEAALV